MSAQAGERSRDLLEQSRHSHRGYRGACVVCRTGNRFGERIIGAE